MTSECATSPAIPTPMPQNPVKSEPISAVPPRATMEDIVNSNGVITNQVTDEAKEPSYYNEAYADKYQRYESDFKQYLVANYFSGEDIYEERTTIDGETIMSSKWPCTHSYVDPDVLQGLHESEVDHCELTTSGMVAVDPTALENKEPERFTCSDSKKRKARSESRSLKLTKEESVVRQTLLVGEKYNQTDANNVDNRRAVGEWMASFTMPGTEKLSLDELDEEGLENYLCYADSFGKSIVLVDKMVGCYEKQLQARLSSEELEEQKRRVAQVDELRVKEVKNAESVKQASISMAKFNSLHKALETAVERQSKLKESEVQINSLEAVAKVLKMTKCQDVDIEKAAQAPQDDSDIKSVDNRRAMAELIASFTLPGSEKLCLDKLDEECLEWYLDYADSYGKYIASVHNMLEAYERRLQARPSSEEKLEEQKRKDLRGKGAENVKQADITRVNDDERSTPSSSQGHGKLHF